MYALLKLRNSGTGEASRFAPVNPDWFYLSGTGSPG